MKSITLDRIVTVIQEVKNKTSVHTLSYRDLKNELAEDSLIVVSYPLGLKKRRTKQLEELGFTFVKAFHNEAVEKHHSVKEEWKRTN